jgi:maltooligosyltrehalose trehalohydrolase
MLHSPTGLRRSHQMRFGPELTDGGVRFRFWAPKHDRIQLKIHGDDEPRPMQSGSDGWHQLEVAGAGPGTLYQFVLPDGLHVPDPASRFQPRDVHGPSEVIDPAAYRWADGNWRGRPWHEAVVYELHVGAFSPEGTFAGAAERLDDLAELGVTAIELMPIADFPGQRNWGYDGVLLFAPDSSYGRPEDLKALVDAAHARGIMVMLDVVYNHFGPDGNYLPTYAPIFTEKHHTPWGAAVNYDAEGSTPVREMIIDNAVYWTQEYNLDGLRLDAVHAIMDDSPTHVLEEIAARVRSAAGDRHVHLVLENEENLASRLERRPDGNPLQFTAQWNDDVHHVLHTAASGENAGYYVEYHGDTEKLGRALAEGFAFQGEMMGYRGHPRGEPSGGLPPTAFVAFIQNHDQVGNRAFGDRITASVPGEAVRAIAAVYLLAPQIPMMFMGEEWGAAQPFPFFCDFDEPLAEAVRNGRRAEFKRFPEFQDPASRERIPDPTARDTFLSAKLRWDDAQNGSHKEWRDWYRDVLAVRHAEIIPRLGGIGGHSGRYEILGDGAVRVAWRLGDGSELTLEANLTGKPLGGVAAAPGRVIWSEGPASGGELGPWAVLWTLSGGNS